MRDMAADDDVIDDEIPTLNDAEIWGESTPEMEALMDRPAVFMAGHLYDQGDRRNTKDGDWKRSEFTWYEWLAMEKIGLTNHPVSKSKQGPSLVFAESLGGARKDSAIKTMFAVGLDIDSGANMDEVIRKLIDLKIFALVYTSHSHGKSRLELKHDDVVRKLKLKDTPNRAQVQTYLREFHKDRYDPEFIDSIKIVDPRHQTKDGLRVIVETPALDKFRVILPLAEPVHLTDLGTTLAQWKTAWENAVCGVAVNMLDVNFDASSCDVNRLFYTPRHPKDADDWYACIVQGKPLHFDEIEPYSKDAYVKKRDDSDPFSKGTEGGKDEVENYLAPSGQSLNRWHKAHKERFLITDVIETLCDDKIEKAGNEKAGTVHVVCPFEHEHSTTGGTATMCMNPTENSEGYWTVFCRHDACDGRNKLEFLQEMLEQEWFEESVLDDEEFNLGAEDSEIDDDPDPDDPLTVAATFGDKNDAEIVAKLKVWLKNGAGLTMQADITEVIVAHTKLGKREVSKLWKLAREENRRKKGGARQGDVLRTGSGFRHLVSETKDALNAANREEPFLFGYLEQPVEIRVRPDGTVRVKALTYDGLSEVISRHVRYEKSSGEDTVSAPPPPDMVKNIHHQHLDEFTLPLRRIALAPFFDKEGNLVR